MGYLVVVLTNGLLQDPNFTSLLLMLERARVKEPVQIMGVLADARFTFPGPEFYKDLEQHGEHYEILVKGMQRMLNVVALPFSPQGSYRRMSIQMEEICSRLPQSTQEGGRQYDVVEVVGNMRRRRM